MSKSSDSLKTTQTKTQQSINESSDRIEYVKNIVRDYSPMSEFLSQMIPESLSSEKWEDKEFSFPGRTIRIGTAFSGIGSPEQALKKLGLNYKVVFAGDVDSDCKKSYFANYDINEEDWFSDIREFDASKYNGKVDLVVGGAPCQAFSMVGKRLGFEDARGTLFYEFARIIKESNPKAFIFENVKGLLSHDGGRTFRVIHDIFLELGYDIHYRVLNSKDYGIPQSRERIFVVGFKDKTDFRFPAPIPLKKFTKDFLEESVDSKYFLSKKGFNYVTNEARMKKKYTQVNGNISICQTRNQESNLIGQFIYFPAGERELNDEELSEFVHEITPVHRRFFAGKNDEYGMVRKLTPRECLRLMGFSDDFKIIVSDTKAYYQSGNSIVANVLEAIYKQMDITKYGVQYFYGRNDNARIY